VKEFLGRYELLGLIATGGMGKVYLARAVGEGGFEREVALKVMHEHLLYEPDFIAMFLDEARLAARIRHPHVVPTLDIEKTDTDLFLVMEFVEGLTASGMLKQLRRRERARRKQDSTWDTGLSTAGGRQGRPPVTGPLPLDMACRIAVDVLSGLHAAHELTDRDRQALNLVHRDVSPGNVLIGADGVARITDFGVARAETRLTSTMGGQIKGKLPYMPPEQLMAAEVDRRADIYSAAVVLWEMLVGRRLYDDEQQGALIRNVLQGASRAPSELNPTVPTAVDAVCMRGLANDPGARFATAADFGEALEEAVRSAGASPANPRQLAAFVSTFDTNVSAMADARKSAPKSSSSVVRRVDLSSPSSMTGPSLPAARSGDRPSGRSVSTITAGQPRSRLGALGWMLGGAALVLVGGVVGVLAVVGMGSNAPAGPAAAATPTVVVASTALPGPVEAPATTASPRVEPTPTAEPSSSTTTEPEAPSSKKRRPRVRRKASTRRKPDKPVRAADEPLPSEFLPGEL